MIRGNQIIFTGKNQIELQEAEWSETELGDNQLLIETEASFVSPGTELAILLAKTERVYQKGAWCEYPWKAGYANVGIVRGIGRSVTGFQVGQRVFSHGRHASACIVAADQLIVQVPQDMDASVAAATRLASISATALHVCDIPRNGWVVVFGLGSIGNFAAQAFKIMGCRVIGIDPSAGRRELAQSCGIHNTFGGSEEEVKNYIRELTEGQMCGVSVDAVGHSGVILQAMKVTANFGQLILLGTPRTPVEGNLTDLLAEIHFRWISVRGALNFTDTVKLRAIQETTFDWVRTGRMAIEPLISHRLPPHRMNEAYEGLMNSTDQFTGVAFQWN